MSKEESQQNWAAIVYGRSYHLDFRFITIPQDFTAQEIAWVSPYILATTQKARNLSNYPRWSLFKNDSHCVVGVTCMVRDLIGKLGKDLIKIMTKDDRGRPLYVFVGYVTKLNRGKSLFNCPAYTGNNLTSFQPLYQEIEKVWLLRDYNDRKPQLSQYKPLNHGMEIMSLPASVERISLLNNQLKYPDKTFVWQQFLSKELLLWRDAANCDGLTSICLNIKDKYLSNSPFLNQTATNIQKFTIQPRITNTESDSIHSSLSETTKKTSTVSFQQKISARAREDIDLTIEHAAKVTSASQEVIRNLTNWSDFSEKSAKRSHLTPDNQDNFGFKNKKEPLPSKKQDWF